MSKTMSKTERHGACKGAHRTQTRENAMINPNRIHRARGVVVEIQSMTCGNSYKVRVVKGDHWTIIEGYDLPKGIKVGDAVNIQARFSIMSDSYVAKTARLIKREDIAADVQSKIRATVIQQLRRAIHAGANNYEEA